MGSLAAAGVQGGAAGAALTDMAQANIRSRRGIESTARQEKDKLSADLYGVEMDRKMYRDKAAERRRQAEKGLAKFITGGGEAAEVPGQKKDKDK